MNKIVSLLKRRPGVEREAFRATCLESLGALDAPRVIVSFVDVDPAEVGLDPASTPPPAYDGVVEVWSDSAGGPAVAAELDTRLQAALSRSFAYRVREIVQKDRPRTWALGERSPGVKGIYPVTRLPGATPEAFVKHWRESHGPLALRHHVGMSKYVQNVVLEPLTAGAPACDGISELHFPTARDLRERLVDSEEGGRIIARDVSRFVGTSLRLDTSEYVLRDGL